MNKKINPVLSIIIIVFISAVFGALIWLQGGNYNSKMQIFQNQNEIKDVLGDIYPIQLGSAVNDRFNAERYYCQNRKIVPEIAKDDFGNPIGVASIKIMSENMELEKIDIERVLE